MEWLNVRGLFSSFSLSLMCAWDHEALFVSSVVVRSMFTHFYPTIRKSLKVFQ